MPKLAKSISLLSLLLILMSGVSKPTAPVAAVEPQQPSSPGSWSAAFASPLKINYSYMPGRPIEWNGTLYAGILSTATGASDAGVGYWNGQQWLKLDGLSGQVDSVAVHQNRLYAAGRLTLGGKNSRIAVWDGSLWTALPSQS